MKSLTRKDTIVWAEMARRYIQFHKGEDWTKIRLWGLFQWGAVSRFLKTGELITDGYTKENKIIWVYPSKAAYEKYIQPLRFTTGGHMQQLEHLAGW